MSVSPVNEIIPTSHFVQVICPNAAGTKGCVALICGLRLHPLSRRTGVSPDGGNGALL